MHAIPVARNAIVSALVAVAMLVGALLIATPSASAAWSDCPSGAVCIWENNNATGNFSWWWGSSTGCHNHAGNPRIRSGMNNTPYSVRWGGVVNTGAYSSIALSAGANPITGDICWPA